MTPFVTIEIRPTRVNEQVYGSSKVEHRFREPLLYPLSYEGGTPLDTCQWNRMPPDLIGCGRVGSA